MQDVLATETPCGARPVREGEYEEEKFVLNKEAGLNINGRLSCPGA
jgi:hypothetical protein